MLQLQSFVGFLKTGRGAAGTGPLCLSRFVCRPSFVLLIGDLFPGGCVYRSISSMEMLARCPFRGLASADR